MTEEEQVIKQCHCLRTGCDNVWFPMRPGRPHVCPKCKSVLWDQEPRENAKEKGGAYAKKSVLVRPRNKARCMQRKGNTTDSSGSKMEQHAININPLDGRGIHMSEVHFDEKVQESWQEYPVRSRGLVECCGKRTVLAHTGEGSFVKQICTECNEAPHLLSESEFKRLDLWVACPGCKKRMEAQRVPDRSFGYVCEQCGNYLKLATLLPRLTNL